MMNMNSPDIGGVLKIKWPSNQFPVGLLLAGLSTSEGGEGDQITMKHGEQLLRYGRTDYKYQGQRWLRDMKVRIVRLASRKE